MFKVEQHLRVPACPPSARPNWSAKWLDYYGVSPSWAPNVTIGAASGLQRWRQWVPWSQPSARGAVRSQCQAGEYVVPDGVFALLGQAPWAHPVTGTTM